MTKQDPLASVSEKSSSSLRFLVFGDVVGSHGRKAVTKGLSMWKNVLNPDILIVNIENIAHGLGLSPTSVEEALRWKADVYTTGDHAWDNKAGIGLLENKDLPIIRPGNYDSTIPGRGYKTFSFGAYEIAVINLQGQVFFKNHPASPFHTLDEILAKPEVSRCAIKLLDFHAEASSEKRGMAWYADGRLSAMWGTHTHIPGGDSQVMPKGMGYISDVGMNGAYDSIIGREKSGPLQAFLHQLSTKFVPGEEGPLEINALLLDINPSTGKAEQVTHIRQIVDEVA